MTENIISTLEKAINEKEIQEALYLQHDLLDLPSGESLQDYYSLATGLATVRATSETSWEHTREGYMLRVEKIHLEFMPVKGELPNFGKVNYHIAGVYEEVRMSPHNKFWNVDLQVYVRGNIIDIEIPLPEYGQPDTTFYKEVI